MTQLYGKRNIEKLFPYHVKWDNTALILNTDETALALVKYIDVGHRSGSSFPSASGIQRRNVSANIQRNLIRVRLCVG